MTDGMNSRAAWLVGILLAAVVALGVGGVSPAHAQTSFDSQMKNAANAREAWGYMVDRAGSASALDQKMNAAAKFNGLGLKAVTAEAPEAGKLLTKRMIVSTLLPRAGALLGPVGWTAAALTTGYTLCRDVFGCFKTNTTAAPPPTWGDFKEIEGLTRYNIGPGGGISMDRRLPGESKWTIGQVAGMHGATSNDPLYGWMQALGTTSIEGKAYLNLWPNFIYAMSDAGPLPEPGSPGIRRVVAPKYVGSYNGKDIYVGIYVAPLEDNVKVEKTDKCPSGETCGELPEPDATWPKQLRDAMSANNDLSLTRRLAAELFPNEGVENPYAPEVTIPKVGTGETAQQYVSRLQDLGLVGRLKILSDYDTSAGPNAVLSVSPDVGTKRKLKDFTEVTVRANPSYALSPTTGSGVDPATGLPTGGATATPTPGSDDTCALKPPEAQFKLSPLSSLSADRFPLSIFVWVKDLLRGFSTSGPATPPDWAIKFGPVRGEVFAWLPSLEGAFGGFWTWVRGLMGAVVWMGAAFGLYRQTFGRGV